MIIMSRKRFEEEVQKRLWEEQRQRDVYMTFDRLEQRICKLEEKQYELREKVFPERCPQKTTACGCDTSEPCTPFIR